MIPHSKDSAVRNSNRRDCFHKIGKPEKRWNGLNYVHIARGNKSVEEPTEKTCRSQIAKDKNSFAKKNMEKEGRGQWKILISLRLARVTKRGRVGSWEGVTQREESHALGGRKARKERGKTSP